MLPKVYKCKQVNKNKDKKRQKLKKYEDDRYIFLFFAFYQKKSNRLLNLSKKTKNLIHVIYILKNY